LILAFQLNFAVIEAAGEKHGAVDTKEGFTIEAVKLLSIEFGRLNARLYRHSVCPLVGVEILVGGSPIITKKMRQPTERVPGFHGRSGGRNMERNPHSRVSNCLRMSANPGSFSRMSLGEAPLKGSSVGMRSIQRCSES